MQLGFAVKVLGEGGLKECDMRRWQSNPHLKCSLEFLTQVLDYCHRNDLRMYRMSSGLAPYVTHPEMPQFHTQIEDSLAELAAVGQKAKDYGIRLSLHPSQYIVLNAIDEAVAEAARRELVSQGAILDAMELGPEAVVVTHVGGAYGDKESALVRFAERYKALPEAARRRLVLENDDTTFSVTDVLRVHQMCGIRLVFDNLHHFCHNPDALPLRDALTACLATWPVEQTPKIHYSSPRTESVEAARKSGKSGEMQTYQTAPDLRLHADYVNPFEFRFFLEKASGLRDFDVMVEAKAKDLAVLKLRKDLAKYPLL